MVLTVRLEPELEAQIDQISRHQGVSKSEWVRRALKKEIESEAQPSAYDIYIKVMRDASLSDTADGTSRRDLPANHRKIFRERVRAKHRR